MSTYCNIDINMMKQLFIAPHLEFAQSAWSPQYSTVELAKLVSPKTRNHGKLARTSRSQENPSLTLLMKI